MNLYPGASAVLLFVLHASMNAEAAPSATCPVPAQTKIEDMTLTVEILPLFDPLSTAMWEKWAGSKANMEEQVKAFFHEVNKIYGNLASKGVNIEIRSLDPFYLDDNLASWKKNQIDPLNQINGGDSLKWLKAVTTKNTDIFNLEFDHVMHFTSHDLADRVLGIAYLSAICGPSSLSVIELKHFNYETVLIAAHELGHSLGSEHDGDSGNQCSGSTGHVMSPTTSDESKNKFFFSDCSLEYFRNYIEKNAGKTKCLQPRFTTEKPNPTRNLGDLISPDTVCEIEDFDGSYARVRKTCLTAYCQEPSHIPGQVNLFRTGIMDGASCGGQKHCRFGVCQ